MVLNIHEPEAAMDGQVIRISNKDRPTSWITFHFESENDAAQAIHFESENDAAQAIDLLKGALQKAVKVEWP
jgi:hypothetical protein